MLFFLVENTNRAFILKLTVFLFLLLNTSSALILSIEYITSSALIQMQVVLLILVYFKPLYYLNFNYNLYVVLTNPTFQILFDML